MRTKKLDYSGVAVSVKRRLVVELVVEVWPAVGHACVCPISDHVDEELRDDLLHPERCILPEVEWPETTPFSRVYDEDGEWYSICKQAHLRGMMAPIAIDKVSKDRRGSPVFAGAMGVDKFKEVDGEQKRFLRFIAILKPIDVRTPQRVGPALCFSPAGRTNNVTCFCSVEVRIVGTVAPTTVPVGGRLAMQAINLLWSNVSSPAVVIQSSNGFAALFNFL